MTPELLSALIAALIGGVVGSTITAWASLAIARSHRREDAAKALWAYHYSLTSLAAEVGSTLGDLDAITLLKSDWEETRERHKVAYPFAGYLSNKARRDLFTSAWFAVDTDPSAEWYEHDQLRYNELSRHATQLENELDSAFPRRFWDRPVRCFVGQGRELPN